MLMHGGPAPGKKYPRTAGQLVGAHAYSRDAVTWTTSATAPYTTLVNFTDGTSQDMHRRERPQLVLSDVRISSRASSWRRGDRVGRGGGDPGCP